MSSAASLAEAARWGRVEGDGHVFLTVDGTEYPVGQYPGVSEDEALGYFARKFDDVVAQIALLEQRVSSKAPTTDMQKTVTHLREQLAERNMVGDFRSAEARLDALVTQIGELEKAEKAEHDAVRAAELAAREAIVAEAEEIAGHDPAQIQWKTSSARMNELFESWKTAQKSGVRLGRSNEDALWKRFRAARTVFDRHRRAYFSQLDSNNSAAKAAKESLIAEAEALSSSTDWGFAAGEYRRLMDEWKASPRASRKDDDALWARFRAAQDVFFTNRQAANDEIDQEYGPTWRSRRRSWSRGQRAPADQGPRRGQEGPAVHPRPLGRSRQGSRAPTWAASKPACARSRTPSASRGRKLEALQPGDQGPHQQRPDPAGVRHCRAQGRSGKGREGRRRAQDQGRPGSPRGAPGLAGAARALGERDSPSSQATYTAGQQAPFRLST